jgi:cation transport regulator ChaB
MKNYEIEEKLSVCERKIVRSFFSMAWESEKFYAERMREYEMEM